MPLTSKDIETYKRLGLTVGDSGGQTAPTNKPAGLSDDDKQAYKRLGIPYAGQENEEHKGFFSDAFDTAKKYIGDNIYTEPKSEDDNRYQGMMTQEKNLGKLFVGGLGSSLLDSAESVDAINPLSKISDAVSKHISDPARYQAGQEATEGLKNQAKEYLNNLQKEALQESPELGSEPEIIPRKQVYIHPPKTIGENLRRGVESLSGGIVRGEQALLSPRNAPYVGGALLPGVGALETSAFGPQMAKNALQSGYKSLKNIYHGDFENAGSNLAQSLGSAALTYGLLRGHGAAGQEEANNSQDSASPPPNDEAPPPAPPPPAHPQTDLKKLEQEPLLLEELKQKYKPILLPENTEGTVQNNLKQAEARLNELPTTEALSAKTAVNIPERVEVAGPETTRTVTRPIKAAPQKISVDADAKDPDAYYDFSNKKFVKDINTTPNVFLGNEKVQEPTGFITKEEVTPETQKTLSYQMEALDKNRTKAVLITPGETPPSQIPPRFKTLDTDVGTWIYDPLKVSKADIVKKVAKGTHGEILGHVEPKSNATTQTVAAMQDGVEAKTSVVSPENTAKQVKILKKQFPDAEIKVGGDELAEEVLKQREVAPQSPIPQPSKEDIVYHGTTRPQGQEMQPNALGLVFASADEGEAKVHAGKSKDARVLSLKLKTKNIFDAGNPADLAKVGATEDDRLWDAAYVETPEWVGKIKGAGFDGFKVRDVGGLGHRGPENIALFDRKFLENATEGKPQPAAPELKTPNNEVAEPPQSKTKVSGLAKRIEAKAIEAGMTKGIEGLSEFETINMKEQSEKSAALITQDYARAKRVAMGAEEAPSGLKAMEVFKAVELHAQLNDDFATIYDLATKSDLNKIGSESGQNLRILREYDALSPVAAIQDLAKTREEVAAKRFGKNLSKEKAKIAEDIKTAVKKAAPTKEAWASFIESIRC